MNINLSFFKKSAITGTGLAIVAGVVMAFFAHTNAINNNQTTTHGAGYELGMTNSQGKLTKINPDSMPKNCGDLAKPTAACRCSDNQSTFCKCLEANDDNCQVCTQSQPSVCFWCPPKSMGIACREIDNNGQTGGGVVTPGNGSSNSGSGSSSQSYVGPPTPADDGSGGNTTGEDNNNQSAPGCGPSTGPHPMGIACVYPGSNGGNSGGGVTSGGGCGYRQFCTAQ